VISGMLKIVIATGLFAGVHSALATERVKRAAARMLGQRNSEGLYRAFFVVQSLATSAALAAYIRRQPGQQLYHVHGGTAWLLRGAQLAALMEASSSARHVGLGHLSGVEAVQNWLIECLEMRPPVAQGPALDDDGTLKTAGPFALSRHPLNFWPIVVLWLNPRMTTRLLAFNVVATAYVIVGSLHEESRLLAAYGEAYREYQRSEVPFFVPRVRALLPAKLPTAGRLGLLPK
jgi:methanethiol S-methyltransferase